MTDRLRTLGKILVVVSFVVSAYILVNNSYNQNRAEPWVIIPLLPLIFGLHGYLKRILSPYVWVKPADRIGIIAGLVLVWSRETVFYSPPLLNPVPTGQGPLILNWLIVGVFLVTFLHILSNWLSNRSRP